MYGLFDYRISVDPFGPFETHDKFHGFRSYDMLRSKPEKYPHIQDALAKAKGRQYKTVFSHGDLGPHNVIWQKGQLFVIDWERSGWFPEYWDYCKVNAARGFAIKWWNMFAVTVSRRYDDEVDLAIGYSGYFTEI